MKLVVVSDSHGKIEVLSQILDAHPDAHAYLHAGDIELPPDYFPEYITVLGNNDYYSEYAMERVIPVGDIKILITHGHQYLMFSRIEQLRKKASRLGCKIAIFGHIHSFHHTHENGIHIVNPGSCAFPRDGTPPSYAVIEIEDENIIVTRINL